MLAAGGIPPLTDGLRQADSDNPGGYYEFENAKKLSSGDVAWLENAPGSAVKVIATLLLHLPDTYVYRVVFMRRRISEVLASQRTMLVNRGEDPYAVADHEMKRIFTDHLERIEPELENRPNFSVLNVDYNQLVASPSLTQLEVINSFLGGDLDVNSMLTVIDPHLYRQRRSG